MDSLHVKYVVVGGGGAGSAAADTIRRRDPVGSILLVGQESSRPYNRPALSKEYLRREKNRMDISIEPVGWYAQHRIEMRTSRRAVHLDTARKVITLDNGEEVAFDKLLLATGASPKPLNIPGADLPNVFYLRSLEDCDRLHHALDKARMEGRAHPPKDGSPSQPAGHRKPLGRAVVVGSGLLAVELAGSFRQIGLHTELVVGRSHPWGKFAGEATGRFVTKYLEGRGIAVHTNIIPARLEGDGRVQHVILTDGRNIDCDFVVVAVGIVPNRDLLRGTPIAAEKAILVDDHCQTSAEGIFAAGDCAAIFDPLFGKHRILDHWSSARLTGAIAGANMAGAVDVCYDLVNSYTSHVFDLKLTAWGDGRFVDRRLVRGTPSVDAPEFAEIGIAADGRVAQVLALGRANEHELFERFVHRRLNVDGHEEAINDPTRDLHFLVG